MASTALEEKINKIRLRNEEIKRRHEEVEADKKNAAKLDALVDPVPTEDWPERKEPPEFLANAQKQTKKLKHSVRKHSDQGPQYYAGSGDGKKAHAFADGQGPPPDPKYNFLADSEREEGGEQIPKDTDRNRGKNKVSRGGFRRRGSGRDWYPKEQWGQQANPGDMTLPEYEAWRAERNRIDEARISRQRTAEGNWRREWDNDKVHLADEVSKRENRVTLGDVVGRQEHGENEKHYRSPRTAPRNMNYGGHGGPYHATATPEASRNHGSANDTEKRVVIATDKSIKVSVNHGSTPPKSSVMSVKVSSTVIAGTGRVGPRQRPRVMYSSQSEADAPFQDRPSFTRHKSADEKIKARQADQSHKAVSPRSPHPQRHRDGEANTKSPYPQRRDNDRVEGAGRPVKKDSQKSPYPQRRGNSSGNYPPKSPRAHRKSTDSFKQRTNSENGNVTSSRGVSDAEGVDLAPPKSLDSLPKSADINNVESNKSLSHAENKDDKNCSVPLKPSLVETSTTQVVEPVLESMKNVTENDKVEQTLLEESASPEIEVALKTEEEARCEGTKDERFDNLYGEPSGTQGAERTVDSASGKDTDVASMDSQAINCSADSGLTSNDSGFIEQPSNDSIHNVSETDTLDTSGIADTSSESLNSGQIAVDRSVNDGPSVERNVPDSPVIETAEPSTSKLEITSQSETVAVGISEGDKSEEPTIDSCIEKSAESISQVHDEDTLAIVSEVADNDSHDKANEIENIGLIEAESKETNSSSLCGGVDTTKDTNNSSSSQLESHAELVEMSKSLHDKPADNPQDSSNDNADKSLAQTDLQDKVAESTENSFGAVVNSQETKNTSNDESTDDNDIAEGNTTAENVSETASSPAIEKH